MSKHRHRTTADVLYCTTCRARTVTSLVPSRGQDPQTEAWGKTGQEATSASHSSINSAENNGQYTTSTSSGPSSQAPTAKLHAPPLSLLRISQSLQNLVQEGVEEAFSRGLLQIQRRGHRTQCPGSQRSAGDIASATATATLAPGFRLS